MTQKVSLNLHKKREANKMSNPMKKKTCDVYVDVKPPNYKKVNENRLVAPVKFNIVEKPDLCKCSPADWNPCEEGNSCINYSSSVECSPNCLAMQNCQNQAIAKRIYPKVELTFRIEGMGP